MTQVKYGDGHNPELKLALLELWKWQCYWCHRPKDFNDFEIDHIIPKSISVARLEELKAYYELPDEFDIHDPQNLAPICTKCNGAGVKGNDEYGKPFTSSLLKKAARLRQGVIKKVQDRISVRQVTANLVKVSQIDLSDMKSRRALDEYAPVILHKLSLLGEEAVDFISFRTVEVEYDRTEGGVVEVGISLNQHGRIALAVLEDGCGCSLEDLLEERVSELVSLIRKNARSDFEAIEAPIGVTSSGPPEIHSLMIQIGSVSYENFGNMTLEFIISGDFEASLSASLVQDNWDGSGLIDLQGDREVSGGFTFVTSWDFPKKKGEIDLNESYINSWESNQ
ncbi:HNH endonuclease [Streptomyces sp. NPDC127110]|uniref:HNH endonuclease n=1 Tax=Streptomyces sp. NPDC127110 TaxID=3345362 RepID=UPI003642E536